MPIMPPSSSSRKAALLAMTALLSMAGCSGGSHLISAKQDFLSPLRLTPVADNGETEIKSLPLRPRIEPAADVQAMPKEEDHQSAWCEHFKEDAAAEATILRSPTLAGSLDDTGKSRLNLRLDASSFTKANIIEKSALIKCRKYLAETGLQKLVFVSPQNLTAAGFRAKADAIFAQKGELAKLRRQIEKALADGSIDREKAAAILVLSDRLLAEGNNAKSQADRRFNEHLLSSKSAERLSEELLVAEADMDEMTSRMRTADNLDVSVQAGWGDNNLDNGFDTSSQAFSGKVSFSMRLGAINPRRFEHEAKSTAFKQDAIRHAEGGVVWQIGVLRRAHERAIAGLEEAEVKLDFAMKEARHLLAVLGSVPQPEFEGARLNARYEIMKLTADRAGIVGSLAEIRTNLNRLKNG